MEDSGYNDYIAFLKLRTIDDLRAVSSWERLVLHSSTPPVAVYVNGKPVAISPRKDDAGLYDLSVQAPADIVVIRQRPPGELAQLHQATMLRVTESDMAVDYYRPDAISDLADGGRDEAQRPVIQDAAVSAFGFQFGGRKHLYLPVSCPPDSAGGILRLHLPRLTVNGKKLNHHLDSITLNLQPLAREVSAADPLPEMLDIPLAPGEVKLITISTKPFSGASFPDFQRPTTRVALEWLEAGEAPR